MKTTGAMRGNVFSAIFESVEGLTDYAISVLVNLDESTVRARRRELVESGAVRERDKPMQVGDRSVPVWILARDKTSRHSPPDPAAAEPEAPSESPTRPLVMLIDGKNILHRGYYGGGRSTSVKRIHDIFRGRVDELVRMFKPVLVIVAYDPPTTWRHRAYPAYKAHRSEKAEALKKAENAEAVEELVRLMGHAFVMVDGYEADDVIATYATRMHHGYDVLIVSSDKDLFQLLRFPGVTQLTGNPGSPISDVHDVEKAFGVRPDQIPDLLAIEGDKVDNIPGVKGVGRKGAQTVLLAFGDVEGVIAAAVGGKDKAKKRAAQIVAQQEELRLFKQLTTLSNVDREACPDIDPDIESGHASKATIPPPCCWESPGMARINGNLEPLPGMAYMADRQGWYWTNPAGAPERAEAVQLEGEPEERWERVDHWGFMYWVPSESAEDPLPGWWVHRHRGMGVGIGTGTDDPGAAFPYWNEPHAEFRAQNPAAPDEWTPDWKTRETSIVAQVETDNRTVEVGGYNTEGEHVTETVEVPADGTPVETETTFATLDTPPMRAADPDANEGTIEVAAPPTRRRGAPPTTPDVTPQETSAAARPTASKSETMRQAVLAHITATGPEGTTDYEIEVELGMKHQTASARRRELVKSGHVERSGRTRPTDTGKNAVVWVVKAPAVEVVPLGDPIPVEIHLPDCVYIGGNEDPSKCNSTRCPRHHPVPTDDGNAREAGEEQEQRNAEYRVTAEVRPTLESLFVQPAGHPKNDRMTAAALEEMSPLSPVHKDPKPIQAPDRTELWSCPVGDNPTGYARVAAAWALEALTGHEQRLIWIVDLKSSLGTPPDDPTDSNGFNDHRWTGILANACKAIVAHETDKGAQTAVGLVVFNVNPEPHEAGPPPRPEHRRFRLDVRDTRVNVARLAHRPPPVGSWVFMSEDAYALYGTEDPSNYFIDGLPF